MKSLLALFLTVSPLCLIAQGNAQLNVTGMGHVETQPDVAVLNIDLKTIRMEFSEAVTTLESDYAQIVKHLEGEGFSRTDIKTEDYGIRPNWIFRDGRSYDSGFVGYHDLTVELANTQANLERTIKAFSKSPVKAKLSITFTVSDSLRASIRNELIKRSIIDARQKASLMADASGKQLGDIVKVTYEPGFRGLHQYAEMMDLSTRMPIPDEVTIKEEIAYTVREMSFEDAVTVTYGLK